jgi:hypothetical protein
MTEQLVYHIWTVQMSKWRLVKERGIAFLDITAKSGIAAFAPDFNDVMRYKRGELFEGEYTKIYLERMARSKIVCPRYWRSLNRRPEIALACYCKAGVFCHRHLFKKLMQEELEQQGFTVIQEGEIENE